MRSSTVSTVDGRGSQQVARRPDAAAPKSPTVAARGARRARLTERRLLALLLYKLLPVVVVLLLWELWGRTTTSIGIPTASETLASIAGLLADGEFWEAFWVSNQAMLLGYAITIILGVPIGLLMGRQRLVDSALQPWFSLFLITPMAMITPLIIMFFGFSLTARTFVVVLFTIPMIVVNARAGVRTVPSDLIDMSRNMGATERQVWRHILLPAAAPSIFAGLRIGLGRAVTAMVIVEWLLAAVGLGALLLRFRGSFEVGSLYALVIVIVAEALLLINALRLLERKMFGWSQPVRPGTRVRT